jgi:mRNA-degrading endonuclease YafQ of YafQ-DinJ toxin-antitoxin module
MSEVPYQLLFTESYTRRAKRFLKRHPELLCQYEKTLLLLELNPLHPSLRLHRLKGSMSPLYSVSINISYRITLYFILDDKKIIPVDVGDHDHVY